MMLSRTAARFFGYDDREERRVSVEMERLSREQEAFLADLDKTLVERKAQHGDFTDHARVAQKLKDVMHAELSWGTLTPTQKEALEMIQHKIARILAGDPNHVDHWTDLEGYARIARERLSQGDGSARTTHSHF